jgi:hypothetical protein
MGCHEVLTIACYQETWRFSLSDESERFGFTHTGRMVLPVVGLLSSGHHNGRINNDYISKSSLVRRLWSSGALYAAHLDATLQHRSQARHDRGV